MNPRRRTRIALSVLAAAVLLPLAGVALLAARFDAAWLKPRIEAAAAQATGRTLRLGGRLRLVPGWTPAIEADDVSLANLPGGSRAEMATARRVVLHVALLPLLHRQVVIDRLELAGVSLLLETDAAGLGNWRFARPPPPTPPGNAVAAAGGARAEPGVAVRAVAVTDARLEWRDGRSGRTGALAIPSLALTRPAAGAPVALTGTVVAGPLTARIEVRSGPPVHVELAGTLRDQTVAMTADVSGGAPVSVNVMTRAGTASLGLAGTAGDPLAAPGLPPAAAQDGDSHEAGLLGAGLAAAGLQGAGGQASGSQASGSQAAGSQAAGQSGAGLGTGLDLQVSLRVPDPAVLGALLGRTLPDSGSLTLAGRVTGDLGGRLALHGFSASGAIGDLSGDLAFTPGRVPSISGSLSASRLDLDALRGLWRSLPVAAPLAGADGAGADGAGADGAGADGAGPQSGTAASGAAPTPRAPLIPDTALRFDRLRRADADVQARIGTVTYGDAAVNDVSLHLRLSGGRLTLDPITARLPGSLLRAALTVDASRPAPAPATLALHLQAPGLAAKAVLAGLGLPRAVDGPLDVLADLHAAGDTPRALAARLDGMAGLAMSGGEIDGAVLRPALDALLRSARLPQGVVDAAGDGTIRCLAARMDFAAGHGTLHPLLVDTPALHVEGEGTVDLTDETLALALRPLARLGGAGVAVPIRLAGSLRAPRATIDTGAVAGAAAAGGGFRAVIGALDAAASSEACGPALAAARGGALPPVPATAIQRQKPPKTIDLLRKLFR